MNLPLLDRATEDGDLFVLTPAEGAVGQISPHPPLTPGRLPLPGEQYRFHLEMSQCIGCKCCVVACNEQNGNPADIQWRRVGEIEGGTYPDTTRLYLSMGCNHCLEPTCMTGCPVNAYTKDPLTGIVLHSADRCIGCQYCTWNCSYGVPQYNPERGVVGKCDMCYGRLTEGREPACVAACPEQAIRIEIVDKEEWRREYAAQANAPGLPSADDSLSSTKVTIRHNLPQNIGRVDTSRVEPEHPHWPLVLMTVFTQMAVGAITAMSIEQVLARATTSRWAAVGVALIALFALGASTLHLGRPVYAFRALSMWRRSWLSREVLFFSLFAMAVVAYAVLLWLRAPASTLIGIAAVAVGLIAVYASARLYLVAARPAWNSLHTIAEFYLTSALTGLLLASVFAVRDDHALRLAACAAAIASVLQQGVKLSSLLFSRTFELRASGELLFYPLFSRFATRIAGLIFITAALAFMEESSWILLLCLAIAIALEILGRYLFFVSVVPKNMAAPYLRQRAA
ncbi:MAG TPA: DmsC/YnfH family molybdoenzyme membrane anchor subunit [Terracidiphilus sp.]|nr:DmsC/YnfH family molybdoenzyme membrane anchor subunit [Terracidiphilus sp.]